MTIWAIAKTLRSEGGWRFLLSKKPRSATSFRLTSELRRDGWDFRTVVDGGANIGQFARASLNAWPSAKVYSFEPLPDVFQILQANLSAEQRFTGTNAALGEHDGNTLIHRSADSQRSSILSSSIPGEQISVPLVRLDSALKDTDLTSSSLLKLDLQGFELPALRGAMASLSDFDAILTEAVLEPAYDGESVLSELWAFLGQQGFQLHRVFNPISSQRLSVAQIDAFFVRADRIGQNRN